MNEKSREKIDYRVLLLGIGDDTPERRENFCRTISEKYRIPFDFMKQIIERCPVVLKKNLPRKKAETLARVLRSYGASASIEERSDSRPISLEFQAVGTPQALLVSARLDRTAGGKWKLVGRVRNLSNADLTDLWVLVQVFEKNGEMLGFEETALPINPLPAEAFSPFRVILDEELQIEGLSIAFKTASGVPVPVRDGRKKRKWIKVDEEGEEEEPAGAADEERSNNGNDLSQAPLDSLAPEEVSPLRVGLLEGTETEAPEAAGTGRGSADSEEKEELPYFPWLEDFRNSVTGHHERSQDLFSTWFRNTKNSNAFRDPFHAVLTILVYSRFDAFTQGEKALRNTQKVYPVLVESNLRREAVPPIEGTSFFPDEQWGELLFRAIPRLQKIGREIAEQGRWNATDLEKLLQVVPHMSDRSSRAAVRRMKDLLPDLIEIDSSGTAVSVTENLYRVAARLGVVDPRFDYYHGAQSAGDRRIQSFARAVFPDDPARVEDPLEEMGLDGQGPCLPIQPRCTECLFDSFCPKKYLAFNPGEKGIIGQNGQSKVLTR